jgi:hypothetical protein
MKGDLWIAVGNEIGNWDDLAHPKQFLAVALVMAKISDWKSALAENLKDQSIEQRTKQPLQNLPNRTVGNNHYVTDALKYFKAQSVRGLWTLDKMVKGNSPAARLKNELCVNLGWLATHPQLMTIGTYGKAEWLKNNLPHAETEDGAHILGRAYGLLAALILPFLANQDTLLVVPAPGAVPDERLKAVISSLLDYIKQSLSVWQHSKIAQHDSGTFTDLQQNHFEDTLLDRYALNSIAEMGAALVSLSQNHEGEIRLHHPSQTWSNVKFFKFEELLP